MYLGWDKGQVEREGRKWRWAALQKQGLTGQWRAGKEAREPGSSVWWGPRPEAREVVGTCAWRCEVSCTGPEVSHREGELRFPGLFMSEDVVSGEFLLCTTREPCRLEERYAPLMLKYPKFVCYLSEAVKPAGGWVTEGSTVPKCSRANPAPITGNMKV